tara:strand:- start:89 stop:679 length:591 start_codon:yes stop_codon:yes gene_type:complete
MIELKSISKKFNSEVLKDFSYLFTNNIYFLRGRNGSGKTTLLKLIKGIYHCDRGVIHLTGELNQRNDITYIDGNFRTFFHRLTVRQNLEYFFSLQNDNQEKIIDDLLDFFSLLDLQHKIFSSLSQGQMQMISLIRGFSSGPKVMLLDEVFSSLDEVNKKIVFKYLCDFILNKENLIVFTSHDDDNIDMSFKELCLD